MRPVCSSDFIDYSISVRIHVTDTEGEFSKWVHETMGVANNHLKMTDIRHRIAGRIHAVGTKAKKFRRRIIGTLSLAVLLILIYQLEILIAAQLGYNSPYAFFEAVPVSVKPFITLLFGPFLHQTASLAFGNIGVLLLTGAYVEYFHGERRLYVFYGVVGYVAAVLPLSFGTVGAIGASGATYGLSSWMAVQATERIWTLSTDIVGEEGILYRIFGHIAALLFGAGSTIGIISLVLSGKIDGAGDATHFLGAMIGAGLGTLFIVYNRDQIPPKQQIGDLEN